ncbi:MAG: hypothetical protein ACRD0H_03675 [Actinomycetes bacterium]
MAISTVSSNKPDAITDFVTFDEASLLFEPTGRPASGKTLRRWSNAAGIRIERRGKADGASYSDLLDVHAERTDARDGLS